MSFLYHPASTRLVDHLKAEGAKFGSSSRRLGPIGGLDDPDTYIYIYEYFTGRMGEGFHLRSMQRRLAADWMSTPIITDPVRFRAEVERRGFTWPSEHPLDP